MKFLKWFSAIVLLLVVIYFLGPKVEPAEFNRTMPVVTSNLKQLEMEVNAFEEDSVKVRPDNEARIIWYDSAYKKTPYSIVYLHGFRASQAEGAPIHKELAQRYGCNLYLSRLQTHGLESEEPMIDFTAEKLMESAKRAIAIGEQLGEKVILFSTSTGGTLSLYLSGGNANVAAQILYSPNIRVFDSKAFLLDNPWGLQIAKKVLGGNYYINDDGADCKPYWYERVRVEALPQLEMLLDRTMIESTFKQVTQPVFLGYYYKNDSLQDHTVSVPAMLEMYDQLGTPDDLKVKVAFPEAGSHVIGSALTSQDLPSVKKATYDFIENVLHLSPVKKAQAEASQSVESDSTLQLQD